MLSLNRPSSPLTNHTRSPQSSRPASPTHQTQDEVSVHSTEPSTHAPPLNAVRQVNLGLARATSAGSGRGKRGSAISGRKSTSLRRKEIPSQVEENTEAPTSIKAEPTKESLFLGPQAASAVDATVAKPSTKEDSVIVEASTSALEVSEEAAPPRDPVEAEYLPVQQSSSPKNTENSRDMATIEQELSFGTAEAKSSMADETPAAQEAVASQALSAESNMKTEPPTPFAKTDKPVISYAAAAAAPAETSLPEPEPSKLGLDLHGEPTTAESQPSAVEASTTQIDDPEPSIANATPSTSTPLDADADVDEIATPPNESVDNDDEASSARDPSAATGDANAGKAGKGKAGKGKGGKNKGKKKNQKSKNK